MKLYIPPGSPYARMARIVVIEKGVERRVEIIAAEIDQPPMHGALNIAQITLACWLGLEARNPYFHWRPQHPKLCDWLGPIAARPSFAATLPPRLQLGGQKVP